MTRRDVHTSHTIRVSNFFPERVRLDPTFGVEGPCTATHTFDTVSLMNFAIPDTVGNL